MASISPDIIRNPYIGTNGNWYVWDSSAYNFVDSEVNASGANIIIRGIYSDVATLRSSVSDPHIGYMYAVGASIPYDLYFYTGLSSPDDYQSLGTLSGPNVVSALTETDITGVLAGDGANVKAATAGELPIVDSGGKFSASDVEGALQEIATSEDYGVIT